MSTGRSDWLSNLDMLFLLAERPNAPLHLGATLIFENGSPSSGGEIDVERILSWLASRVERVPRWRQRLAFAPIDGRALWIDDEGFDLSRHVHHVRLPTGGDERSVRGAAAEILARPLDRARPLWELWILDGAAPDRFAMVAKVHHCLADGRGGVAQLVDLLSTSPTLDRGAAAPWRPRPAPGRFELFQESLSNAVSDGVDAAASLGARFSETLLEPVRSASSAWRIAGEVGRWLRPVLRTPINEPVGAERQVEWIAFDRAEVRRVRTSFGCTPNEVVLSAVAGGLGRYFRRRGFEPGDREVRAAVPVAVAGSGTSANRLSLRLVSLPTGEKNGWRRLEATCASNRELRRGAGSALVESLLRCCDWLAPAASQAIVPLFERHLPCHLVVSNLPGPERPLYLGDARLLAIYPSVPLFGDLGLAVAVVGYGERLFWGFVADPASVPDLAGLVYDVAVSFCELLEVAGDASGTGGEEGRDALSLY